MRSQNRVGWLVDSDHRYLWCPPKHLQIVAPGKCYETTKSRNNKSSSSKFRRLNLKTYSFISKAKKWKWNRPFLGRIFFANVIFRIPKERYFLTFKNFCESNFYDINFSRVGQNMRSFYPQKFRHLIFFGSIGFIEMSVVYSNKKCQLALHDSKKLLTWYWFCQHVQL